MKENAFYTINTRIIHLNLKLPEIQSFQIGVGDTSAILYASSHICYFRNVYLQ